ncbi:MAG: RDD family protein [Nitrosopumilus sp.]|uniref:RDD family protein n=1 Tax=Nitrosopumilus sp. TaxID=2024843 RepID=UPI00292F8A89|nr:RDD family protein [Nitrosopumilus sp.]
MSNSDSRVSSKVIIAKWTDRFLAWLIDFIVISLISTTIVFAVFGTVGFEFEEKYKWAESTQYLLTSVLFFIYWTILEYKTGQTIGKKILNLRTTNIYGETPTLKAVLISSFGKAFLIPIDVILGWIFTNEKRQRMFNKLGDTLVTKIKIAEDNSDIRYIKD